MTQHNMLIILVILAVLNFGLGVRPGAGVAGNHAWNTAAFVASSVLLATAVLAAFGQ